MRTFWVSERTGGFVVAGPKRERRTTWKEVLVGPSEPVTSLLFSCPCNPSKFGFILLGGSLRECSTCHLSPSTCDRVATQDGCLLHPTVSFIPTHWCRPSRSRTPWKGEVDILNANAMERAPKHPGALHERTDPSHHFTVSGEHVDIRTLQMKHGHLSGILMKIPRGWKKWTICLKRPQHFRNPGSVLWDRCLSRSQSHIFLSSPARMS